MSGVRSRVFSSSSAGPKGPHREPWTRNGPSTTKGAVLKSVPAAHVDFKTSVPSVRHRAGSDLNPRVSPSRRRPRRRRRHFSVVRYQTTRCRIATPMKGASFSIRGGRRGRDEVSGSVARAGPGLPQ